MLDALILAITRDPDRPVTPLTLVMVVLFFAAGAVLVGVIGRWVSRRLAFPCRSCGHPRVQFFRQLAPDEQVAILEYFERAEGRSVEPEHLYVCPQCRRVLDDFSGSHRSRDMQDAGLYYGMIRTWCKVCDHVIWYRDRDREIRCTQCNTRYEWRPDEASGYVYFAPEPGRRIRTDRDELQERLTDL